MTDDSRHPIPHTRAARLDPPNLPRHATQTISARIEPEGAAVEQADLRFEAGEREEERQQENDREVLQLLTERADELRSLRHDRAHQKCAEEGMDSDDFRRICRSERQAAR